MFKTIEYKLHQKYYFIIDMSPKFYYVRYNNSYKDFFFLEDKIGPQRLVV